MHAFSNLRALDAFGLVVGLWLLYKLWRAARSREVTTKLLGPPATSWLFGVTKDVFDGDAGDLYENWAKIYGSVFQIPGPLGERRTVLTDPKAIAHCWSNYYTFQKSKHSKQTNLIMVGKGILWAEGETHRRQRKTLNVAFTNAAIRDLLPVFFESAYKVKAAWDRLLSSSPKGEAIIDVTKWANSISLDSIGIAGFGHDFGSLRGEHSVVEQSFDSLMTVPKRGIDVVIFLLAFLFPSLLNIPTQRRNISRDFNRSLQNIAEDLLRTSQADKQAGVAGSLSRSITGVLIKAESAEGNMSLTTEEVLAQMKTLLVAGSVTTGVTIVWAFIELSLHPDKQERLREEISALEGNEPTYEQLTSGLPYLDAIMRETLRLHSPVHQNHRLAIHEDVIPLSEPIRTASGELVEHITVGAGVPLTVPIRAINRSEKVWGPDAKEFKPERWLNNESGLPPYAKEMRGFHHLLSFLDGPRICLGKLFAVAEFKAVLAVLVRSYVFEMRDGPHTKIENFVSLLPRPKVAGEEGSAMPLRVRRAEH